MVLITSNLPAFIRGYKCVGHGTFAKTLDLALDPCANDAVACNYLLIQEAAFGLCSNNVS